MLARVRLILLFLGEGRVSGVGVCGGTKKNAAKSDGTYNFFFLSLKYM